MTAIGYFLPIQLILNFRKDLKPFNPKINGAITVSIMKWLNRLRS